MDAHEHLSSFIADCDRKTEMYKVSYKEKIAVVIAIANTQKSRLINIMVNMEI